QIAVMTLPFSTIEDAISRIITVFDLQSIRDSPLDIGVDDVRHGEPKYRQGRGGDDVIPCDIGPSNLNVRQMRAV
ncbi:Hypp9767, partial [Branchiostoma lanceolatum]